MKLEEGIRTFLLLEKNQGCIKVTIAPVLLLGEIKGFIYITHTHTHTHPQCNCFDPI